MCSLCAQDIAEFISIFKSQRGLDILAELAEQLSAIKLIYLKREQTNDKKRNKKKPVLAKEYPDLKHVDTLPPITADMLNSSQQDYQDIYALVLNNRLKSLDTLKTNQGYFTATKYVTNLLLYFEISYNKHIKDYLYFINEFLTIKILKTIIIDLKAYNYIELIPLDNWNHVPLNNVKKTLNNWKDNWKLEWVWFAGVWSEGDIFEE